MASAHSLTTYICQEPRLQISRAILPLKLSASMAHSETTLFYLYLLPTCIHIYLKRSYPFWSHNETFLYITYPLHAHYMTHLFHQIQGVSKKQ